jgi:acyl carrier protein
MQVARSLKFYAPRLSRAASAVAVEAPAGSYLSSNEVSARVLEVLKSVKSCPADVTFEHNFASDLRFDSMIRKEIINKVSDQFCVPISAADSEKFVNGGAIAQYISKHPKAR